LLLPGRQFDDRSFWQGYFNELCYFSISWVVFVEDCGIRKFCES
jgi:hypothetical protein